MSLKDSKTLFHTVEGKLYQFHVDADSKLSHLQECFLQWLKVVGNIADEVAAQQAARPPVEEAPKTETQSQG